MTIKPYYEHDGIVIYNCDNREVLPTLPKFDLLLTDPPYGIGESSKKQATRGGRAGFSGSLKWIEPTDFGYNDWDKEPPSQETIDMSLQSAGCAVIWGGNYFGLPASSCWLVWDKDNFTNDFADCELAWTNMKKAVRKFKWRWNGMLQEEMGDKKENRVHPTQKPLALMRWCLSFAPDAKTILDPFMGSGTTLVAAKREGRKAVGIELEERYCEAAVKRLQQGVFDFDS